MPRRAAWRRPGSRPTSSSRTARPLYHWVEGGHARGTLQLGEPAWIAERMGAPVLSDVRIADIAAGGEGAPLMAALRPRVARRRGGRRAAAPIATVNLGGIANVQLVRPGGDVVAFDSGPGNCLIDAVVSVHSRGATRVRRRRPARGGRAGDDGLLEQLLRHPYFAAPTPKSTGRETFDLGVVDAAIAASGSRSARARTTSWRR